MSTRGYVAIKENGKYKYIYNHHDSYIDGLGITLYKYYKNVNKVKELIALGNTSSIGSTVEEGRSKTYKEHLDKPLEQRGTVAAFRDINRWEDCCETTEWEDEKPLETEYLSDVLGEEFTYIFDTEDNRWYFAYWNDKYRLRDLEKTLHSKELLEKLFNEMYRKDYLPEFYNKCLNA
ncbi:hypothetical protein [Fusicatenibacter saccharivorans]|uniref:hypothetical protein n=1 Tax=Fusicatenibacter saccharivorans TaxID=1150298 RepID=UPI0034A5D237